MQKIFTSQFIFSLLFFLTSHAVVAGTIRGTVENDRGFLTDITVYMESASGRTFKTITNKDGSFFMKDLPADFYMVYVQPSPDLHVFLPECGYYFEYLDEDLHLMFRSQTTGVMVDFGDPSGVGNKNNKMGSPAPLEPGQFNFSLFAYDLNSLAADTIVVDGYWSIPGHGPLNADVINGWASGPNKDTLLVASYFNLAGPQMQYAVSKYPTLCIDGEQATFTVDLTPQAASAIKDHQGRLSFCGTLRVYRDGKLLYNGPFNWNGNIQQLDYRALESTQKPIRFRSLTRLERLD